MTAMIMPCVMTVLEVSSAFVDLATQVMGLKTAQVEMANYLHFFIPIFSLPFPDIDECALGTHTCDMNAYCENYIGSYDCICKDGYIENGTFCISKEIQCFGS